MKHIAAVLVVLVLLTWAGTALAEGIPPNDPAAVVVEGRFLSRWTDRACWADGVGNLVCEGYWWLNIRGYDGKPYTCPASKRVYDSAVAYKVGRPMWPQVCYPGQMPLMLR